MYPSQWSFVRDAADALYPMGVHDGPFSGTSNFITVPTTNPSQFVAAFGMGGPDRSRICKSVVIPYGASVLAFDYTTLWHPVANAKSRVFSTKIYPVGAGSHLNGIPDLN